jgi:hypothetical protein
MKLKIILASTHIILAIILYFIGSNNGKLDQIEVEKNYTLEELTENLKKKESEQIKELVSQDLEYASDRSYSYYKREYINENYVKGYIKNNSSIVNAKDFVVKIDYFTKTNKFISSQTFDIYEYVKPKDSLSVKILLNLPENTETIDVSLTSIGVE